MKRITSFILFLVTISVTFAQNPCESRRYIDDLFDVEFTSEPDIFATADALIYPPYVNEAATFSNDLKFNLYEPMGDTLTKRPLVIFAFGGAFLLGTKLQPQIVTFANDLARKGFVVATIDYRLGMDVLNEESAVRAVYRGAQDVKAAVRYFRTNAATYRIDPDNIAASGNSAGSISALHAAYVDEIDRANSPLFAPTYFVDNLLIDWPDLGCINCSGNPFEVDGKPNYVLNLWGAIGDVNWIDANEAPIISFHGDDDFIVDPAAGAPFGADAIFPILFGTIPIHAQADAVGLKNEIHLYPGQGHEPWFDSAYGDLIQMESADFLYDCMKPLDIAISGKDVVCNNEIATYCVRDTPGSEFCWEITNGTIIANNNDCITVEWDNPDGVGTLSVMEKNCLDINGNLAELSVFISAIPDASFTFAYNDIAADFTPATSGVSYAWDFGDGTTSTSTNPSHTYSSIGVYTVTLTVVNSYGCTDTKTLQVEQTCQPTYLVTSNPTPAGLYKAIIWVESSNPIAPGNNAIFIAGDCVNLKPGFEVSAGDEFLGTILPCSN